MQFIVSSFVGLLAFITTYRSLKTKLKYHKAIATLDPFGSVVFEQLKYDLCRVACDLKNVSPGLHGLHVHEFGDLREGCKSTCSHYNPTNKNHGGALGCDRHRGDLGNISVDENGSCKGEYLANINIDEIIGRGLILHEDPDDLGQGSNEESKKTGNAGKRIACGVIGVCASGEKKH